MASKIITLWLIKTDHQVDKTLVVCFSPDQCVLLFKIIIKNQAANAFLQVLQWQVIPSAMRYISLIAMCTVVVRILKVPGYSWWVNLKCGINSINIPWYISVAKIMDYFLCCKPYVSSKPSFWFFRLCAIISVYACQPWEYKLVLHQWAFQKGKFREHLQTCLWATSFHFNLKLTHFPVYFSNRLNILLLLKIQVQIHNLFACGCKYLCSVFSHNNWALDSLKVNRNCIHL